MADQHPESKPEGEAPSAPPAPAGSQVPLPNLIAGGGVFSPTTEKQVSDLLAEMQQYASTAAPGTTTTMQFSYQKSKHTSETSGQEPKVVESSHFEKAIHQTPPPEQPQPTPAQPEAAAAVPASSIFSQIPQFLQEKLGFGGGATPAATQVQTGANQQTQVSYHHSKKTTTTTTTSSGGEQQTTTTTSESSDVPTTITQESSQAPAPAPTQPAQQEDAGLFAPLKTVAEKLQEQVSHIPQMLQEKFGGQQHPSESETTTDGGQQHTEISYQHTKKTTTTTSSSSTAHDDQHQHQVPSAHPTAPVEPEAEKSTIVEPLKEAAGKVVSGLEHLVEQAANLLPHSQQQPTSTPTGNVQMEFSKHSSRQVMTQSGEQPPHIETTSSGYTQLVHGIFDGMPVIGGIVPTVVPVSVSKSDLEQHTDVQKHHFDQTQSVPQTHAEPAPGAPSTTSLDASAQLEEQLKKLGIQSGHPMTDLLQQTLAQHQRAKTPESNIEIQYSAQRTHSSRTVTYETAGSDPKAAHEALQQLQGGLGAVQPPSQGVPESPANTSQQRECVEGSHIDDEGNLVISKKVTRVTTTTRTVYDEGGKPKTESKQTEQTTDTDGGQPPVTQG